MIAYIFWHAPAAGSDIQAYETQLVRFHEQLATAAISGYKRSYSCAVSGLPWVSRSPAYEDWYVLADSAALDRINEAALGAHARALHDSLAAAADFGAGGLYRHRSGPDGTPLRYAHWFDKPRAMSYAELADALVAVPEGGVLWQRQMVLGPGREFCLLAPREVKLPEPLEVLVVDRRPL